MVVSLCLFVWGVFQFLRLPWTQVRRDSASPELVLGEGCRVDANREKRACAEANPQFLGGGGNLYIVSQLEALHVWLF